MNMAIWSQTDFSWNIVRCAYNIIFLSTVHYIVSTFMCIIMETPIMCHFEL